MLCHPFVARSRARHLLALPVLLLVSAPAAPAGAQATTLDHPSTPHADVLELTFEEAIDLALVRPEARVAEQVRARRADADADVGRWVGNPQVQVQVGRRRRPQPDVGVEAQITLLQGFALGRVGAARLEGLAAELGALDVEERAERMLAALSRRGRPGWCCTSPSGAWWLRSRAWRLASRISRW
ncbi:MAG: hypothetical protein IPI43_05040 [Sandaracinaceae bacterium]|nr:hypothetical protein [Sandaracinaceae bacterium]